MGTHLDPCNIVRIQHNLTAGLSVRVQWTSERPCSMDVGASTATRLSVDQKETCFGILLESSFISKNIGSKQFWRANF